MDSPPRTRLRELDALRGVAAVSVVGYHYTQIMHALFGVDPGSVFASPWLSWLYPFGAGEYGVSLFFMISGFVIFMTLARTRRAMDFVVSRFARLYPAFWCGVAVTSLVRIGVRGDDISWQMFAANLTMVPAAFGQDDIDGVYWTLVVELQFYALMFLVWRSNLLMHVERISAAWLSLLLVSQLAATFSALEPVARIVMTALILKHIPLFAAGMMFHRIYTDGLTALRGGVLAAAFIATWLSGNFDKAIVVTLSFAALTLLVTGSLNTLGKNRMWLWLGDRSYAIYLVHLLIGEVLMHKLAQHTQSSLLIVVPATLCTLGLAVAIHRFVEQPAIKAIRGWYATSRTALAPR